MRNANKWRQMSTNVETRKIDKDWRRKGSEYSKHFACGNVFNFRIFHFPDIYSTFYLLFHFKKHSVKRGELPLWELSISCFLQLPRARFSWARLIGKLITPLLDGSKLEHLEEEEVAGGDNWAKKHGKWHRSTLFVQLLPSIHLPFFQKRLKICDVWEHKWKVVFLGGSSYFSD